MSGRTPLVLIHGLLGSCSYFDPQSLLPGLDIHAPDLIGYGANRSIDEGITLQRQAAEIVRVLREDVGRPAWLLGHSVGGAVMMLAAEQVPERVAGLISVEGNFTLKDAFWCSRIAAMPEADWAAAYGAMEDDPAGWLERSGVEASDLRIAWAREILANQPYTAVQAMARSVPAPLLIWKACGACSVLACRSTCWAANCLRPAGISRNGYWRWPARAWCSPRPGT
jgi:pimeloyl-ACP methyl ester carboxylesterase